MNPVLIHALQSRQVRNYLTALQHIANGKTNGETAALMNVDPHTITDWLSQLNRLMETKHTRHTIAEALRKKLIV